MVDGVTNVKKVGLLYNEKRYQEGLKIGLLIYNSKNVLNVDSRIQLIYWLSLIYKKLNSYDLCDQHVEKCIILCEMSGRTNDIYNRALILKNENMIANNKDDGLIGYRYYILKKCYEETEDDLMLSLTCFNIGKYYKDKNDLLIFFKKLVDSCNIKIKVLPNFNISSLLNEGLNEIKEIDEETYNEAKTYLYKNISISIKIVRKIGKR